MPENMLSPDPTGIFQIIGGEGESLLYHALVFQMQNFLVSE